MDSPSSSADKNIRKNLRNILTGLGFKDTPESRKLDPWMIAVLARQKEEEKISSTSKPPILLSDSNHSTSPLKNHDHSNIKKRPLNDLDSVSPKKPNDKNLSFKKPKTSVQPRSGLVKTSLEAPAHRVEKELPVDLRNMILGKLGGSDLLFVTEKALTCTDLNPHQSRLSIPERQVANEFLDLNEKAKVKKGIDAKLLVFNHDYQPGVDGTQEHNINLTMWDLPSTKMYALNKTWNAVVKEHKLKENMCVQLWAFRVQSELYFALVKL